MVIPRWIAPQPKGWPDWSRNCARPTRAFGGRALREQRRPTGYPSPPTPSGVRSTLGLLGDRIRSQISVTLLPHAPLPLQAFLILFVAGALLRLSGLLVNAMRNGWASSSFPSISRPRFWSHWIASPSRRRPGKCPSLPASSRCPLVLASWPIARLLHLARPTQGGFLLAIGCINSVYFAYPVALATFGEEGLAQAILFDLGQTMLTLTALYALASWHGTFTPHRHAPP